MLKSPIHTTPRTEQPYSKEPFIHPKSPYVHSKEPNEYVKEPYLHNTLNWAAILQRALHTLKRAIHTSGKIPHTLKRAPWICQRALFTRLEPSGHMLYTKELLHPLHIAKSHLELNCHPLKSPVYTQKSSSCNQNSPTYTQKSPSNTLKSPIYTE